MRYWIYGHIAAVICCALIAIAERYGMLVSPRPLWISVGFGVTFWPSLLAMFVCPFAVFLLILTGTRPGGQVLTILLAETVLTFGHLAALHPFIAH